MLTLIPMLLGKFNLGKYAMSCTFFRTMAKTTYIVAIIHPIVIGLMYDTGQQGLYLDTHYITVLGAGNVCMNTCFALILFVWIEYPFKKI
jgi:hypothetical protein